jgi:hypothetical protein
VPLLPDGLRASRAVRVLDALLLTAAVTLGVMLLWLAARPLSIGDLWFHLKTGETYLHEGLWPKQDPMLFTGFASGPKQHEWLFEVIVHSVDHNFGYQGLRCAHVLFVVASLAVLFRTLRQASGSWQAAAVGGAAFLAIASQRLMQFRPDLWTIPATMLVYGAFIARSASPPGVRKLLLGAVLFCLWANSHSLVVIGVVLLAAAAVGAGLEWSIVHGTVQGSEEERAAARARFVGLCSALLVSVLACLVHPRGYHQLLTFVESSADSAVTEIRDEWTPFDVLAPGAARPLAWAVVDLLLTAFAYSVWLRLRALRRTPTSEQLSRFDPPGFIAAAAACGAMLISVRYLWLGYLPLMYCLRAFSTRVAPNTGAALPLQAAGLLLTAAVCSAFPSTLGFRPEFADSPSQLGSFISTPSNRRELADEGVDFLSAIRAEGRIFSPYLLGSYIGYRLAPRLRTFIDSRTEHYPRAVFESFHAISSGVALPDGRDPLRALDDYGVDFVFCTGFPGYPYDAPYTLDLLEHKPGWVLVFRNSGQALYLRAVERNRGNAARVAEYYAGLGIPYDATRGFDVAAAINTRLDWAVAQRIVPRRLPELERQTREGSAAARAAASIELADALYAAGAFRGAAHYAKQALPDAREPGRALTLALQALKRANELPAAEALLARVRSEHASDAWFRSVSVR